MKYLLLMYADATLAPNFSPEEQQSVMKDWQVYMKEASAAGVLLSNHGIDPAANATTVRVRGSKTLTTDGPFAETHEQLGGFSVLECKDLDEAIHWAEKIPTVRYGTIEIRSLWAPG